MDSELAKLKRAYTDAPGDPEVAQRYEHGLRRAGLRDEVDALYRLAFHCPLAWNELQGDPYDDIRACSRCERDVYYVRNRRDMARWVAQGECVALDPETLDESIRVLADVSLTDATQVPAHPCVIEVQPGAGPESLEGIRGMIQARFPEPPTSEEQILIDEVLDEVDRGASPAS